MENPERGPALTFWMARARDTPGSPTSWRVFLPSTWNFCRLTFTSNGLALGLARPPRAPAGVPGALGRAPVALAFPMANSRRTPRRWTPHGLGDPEEASPRPSTAGGERVPLRETRAGLREPPRPGVAITEPGTQRPNRLSLLARRRGDYNSQQATLFRRAASAQRGDSWEP